MEESSYVCPSCGKLNPANSKFCYTCGTLLAAREPSEEETVPSLDAHLPLDEAEPQIPEAPYAQTQPQYAQPAPQAAPPLVSSPAYSPQAFPPSKPPKRGRVRCCAIGCLLVLLVLLIGLPVLHVTVLRPIIEREIYKQVSKSLKDVNQDQEKYRGSNTETYTEREINQDAVDVWDYVPGSSDGYISLQQDQIKLDVKIYGVKVWAATDLRVNNDGEFVVKSLQMSWPLHVLFSEGALKREVENYVNEKVVRPRDLNLLAFQVSEGMLFIAYEGR